MFSAYDAVLSIVCHNASPVDCSLKQLQSYRALFHDPEAFSRVEAVVRGKALRSVESAFRESGHKSLHKSNLSKMDNSYVSCRRRTGIDSDCCVFLLSHSRRTLGIAHERSLIRLFDPWVNKETFKLEG